MERIIAIIDVIFKGNKAKIYLILNNFKYIDN